MNPQAEARIVDAAIGAGHDGQAELVLRVRHENGVVAPVILDGDTGFRLMAGRDANDLQALIGRPWREILMQTILGENTHA
jgi:hypothetical protein